VRAPLILAAAALIATGCGSQDRAAERPIPISVGSGPRFRPPSLSRVVSLARPVGRFRCEPSRLPVRHGVHLELFAARHVVVVPAGIGIAPPRRADGAYIRGGRCSYAVSTREPTGVIEVAGGRPTLGDLFAVWGQPLRRARFAGFSGTVRAYVDGRRWHGHPRAIPLTRHAQIVLAVGPPVPVHPSYRFPAGL
jgi:hypothetical protein